MTAAHAEPTKEFTVGRALTWAALGTAAVGAGIILAPHVLPSLGVGTVEDAKNAFFTLHGDPGVLKLEGSGLAGLINDGLKHVPLIGEALSHGGFFNAAATGVIGVGGVLLGGYIHRKEEKNDKEFSWGKVIEYGALATSALIALPTVLTALSAGLIYLGNYAAEAGMIATESASKLITGLYDTLGGIGYYQQDVPGLSGALATLPHFVTCGFSMLPAALTFGLWQKKDDVADMPDMPEHSHAAKFARPPEEKISFAKRVQAPLPPPQPGIPF